MLQLGGHRMLKSSPGYVSVKSTNIFNCCPYSRFLWAVIYTSDQSVSPFHCQ